VDCSQLKIDYCFPGFCGRRFFEAFWAVLFLKVRGRRVLVNFLLEKNGLLVFFDNKHE